MPMDETPNPYPTRRTLDHRGPVRIDTRNAVYFITIDAKGKYDAGRAGSMIPPEASGRAVSMKPLQWSTESVPFSSAGSSTPPYREILDAARFRQERGDWFLYLFLVMPDHIHMLAHFPPDKDMMAVITDFKRYLSTAHLIRFQRDFFDTRIRDAAHFAEKWDYIVRNPVRRGLCESPREWPHVIAYDPATVASASVGAGGFIETALPCVVR